MLLQNPPTTLDGVIFAVVGRIVQQLDDFAGAVGKLHHALEELRAHAAAFWAIVHLKLYVGDLGPLLRGCTVPPLLQAIHEEVAGLEGASKRQMQPPTILLHDPEWNLLFLAAHVVIGGLGVAAGFPTPRVVPKLLRVLAIEAQAPDLPTFHASPARYGLPVLIRQVGEDGVGFREFFGGLAFPTLRRR